MIFVAGARLKHLGAGILLALIVSIIIISAVPHVRERFQGFMRIGEECLEDYCWQSQQANIAVGSGGFWGKGLTQGIQKSYWLPQASDDFIFAASAEELGFLRIIFIVLAYFMISLRGYSIANKAQNNFEMFAAVGITTWIVVQAFINIAVNTALAPVTGITLHLSVMEVRRCIIVNCGGHSYKISTNTLHYARSSNRRGNRRSRNSKLGRYRRA